MKKGLLSLLAVVLTVVGCQNYDDQFAALNKDIAAINTAIAGLATVSADVSALKTTISGIQSGVTANGSASSALTAALAAAATDIDAIEAAVAGVASAADLTLVSSALTAVQADVKEILAANSVINQDVTINSVATLEYAESLISTKTDAPTVIVNGNVVVTTGAAVFTAAQLARVNLVTAKIATVLKNLTVSNTATPAATTVDFGALTFVDGAAGLNLTGATSTPKLKTITNNLVVNVDGAVDYSTVANIGGTVTIGGAGVTSLNLTGVTIGGAINTDGSGAGILVLPKATTINVGTAEVISLNATVGTAIVLGKAAALASLSVTAPVATQIDILATSVTGALTIATGTPTLVFANSITAAGATTVNAVAQFHATTLVDTNAASSIAAEVVNLPLWAGTASGTMAMAGAHTAILDGLQLPSAVLATNALTAAAAKKVTVLSTTAALLTAEAAETVVIKGLADTTDFITDAGFAALKTLNVTGVPDTNPSDATQSNSVGATAAAAALTDLIVGGTVHDVSASAAGLLKNVTLTGAIGDITMNALPKLESLAIGTSHIEGASASTLVVTANPIITSLAPTAMSEVKTIEIQTNTKLASIDFSALTALPSGSAVVSSTFDNNALSATYVYAVAPTETTAYVDTVIKSDDILSLKPYIDAATASGRNTPTFNFNIGAVVVGSSAAASLTAVILKDAAIGNGDQTPAASSTVTGTTMTLAPELAVVVAE
jgi:hypothetical protein